MARISCIILGGGKGTRLYPLTKERAKPAVPFGAKYRLVDIPISNCINSGLKQIYVLTQFNTASLHTHISHAFRFDTFTKGFIEILAAEQTFDNSSWYQGTADAVRQNLIHFRTENPSDYIILSGDQLYRMDFMEMYRKHAESGADLTLAATPVDASRASSLGILRIDRDGNVLDLVEKPSDERQLDGLGIPADMVPPGMNHGGDYLGSMGIYIFKSKILEESLDNDFTDFGKEVIPEVIRKKKVGVYVFNGFWEDVGTIRAFYDMNISLTLPRPPFNFYHEESPIYTHIRHLPSTKFNLCTISQSLVAEGSRIDNASIVNSIIGIRSNIASGASLDGVICMGANSYESEIQKKNNAEIGLPNMGIGRGTAIRKVIIDKNARIGDGCRIGVDNIDRIEGDHGSYFYRDGIVIIPKNSTVPHGTVI